MVLAIAAALTTGQPLPGQIGISEPIDILYQTAEDSYNSTVKPRLERLGADCNRVHVILTKVLMCLHSLTAELNRRY
jgi:hypothetical protein